MVSVQHTTEDLAVSDVHVSDLERKLAPLDPLGLVKLPPPRPGVAPTGRSIPHPREGTMRVQQRRPQL